MKIKSLAILAIALLFGCTTLTKEENDLKPYQLFKENKIVPYQLHINRYGNLRVPAGDRKICSDGAGGKGCIESETRYVKNIIDNFNNLNKTNEHNKCGPIGKDLTLTILIHGGLNNIDDARKRVKLKEVVCPMLREGKYPLFISWDSGPISNYKDHVFHIRRGKLERFRGILSFPFVLLEDLVRSIARIPASSYEVIFGQNTAFKRTLTRYNKEESEAKALKLNLQKQVNEGGLNIHDDDNDNTVEGINPKKWLTIWNPIKLVAAPFVDGLGSGAWDSMLRRTDLILRKDNSRNNQENDFNSTAVSKFFNKFSIEHGNVDVTIIGHSMGAIVVNNIVSKYPDMKFKNIVYMAAACRLKDIEYVVVPYLQRNSFAHFYNLSLHPYRDISENAVYDFLPRGSLLMWIDQTFGETNSLSDRTAGYWFNIIRAANNIFSKPVRPDHNSSLNDAIVITASGDTATQNYNVVITARGGTAPLTYSKDNGVTFQNNNNFTGLKAANYDIVVMDANGWQTTTQVTLTEEGPVIGGSVNEDVRQRVHLTKFGIENGPKKHGHFFEHKFKYWQERFWKGKVDL